jgi:RHS repeat-associated protein
MPNRSEVPSGADQRYKFSSKERNSETGLDYFGRRNYDSPSVFVIQIQTRSRLKTDWFGGWYEVDPMADNYAGWSSYNYALDNPVNLIDPNGAYSYTIDGVPIDQGWGEELVQEYQQEQFLQGIIIRIRITRISSKETMIKVILMIK